MRSVAFIFFMTILGAVIMYLLMDAIGVPSGLASNFSAVFLGFLPFLHQLAERREVRRTEDHRETLSFQGYSIAAWRMVLYGLLVGYAISNIPFMLGAMMAEAYGAGSLAEVGDYGAFFVFLIIPPFFFFLGRWVGLRTRSHGWLVITGIAILVRLVGVATDYLLIGSEEFVEMMGIEKGPEHFALAVLIGTAITLPFLAWGYWRGRRNRISGYVSFLLRYTDPSDRDAIVELAYEQAVFHKQAREEPAPENAQVADAWQG